MSIQCLTIPAPLLLALVYFSTCAKIRIFYGCCSLLPCNKEREREYKYIVGLLYIRFLEPLFEIDKIFIPPSNSSPRVSSNFLISLSLFLHFRITYQSIIAFEIFPFNYQCQDKTIKSIIASLSFFILIL